MTRARPLGRLALPLGSLAAILVVALAAPILPLPSPIAQDSAQRLAPPSLAHWLGQDDFGRDELARLVGGARSSLSIALIASALAAIVGSALGTVGGYFRGAVEWVTVRVAEIVLCFPPLLLALLVVTLLGPGSLTLTLTLAVLFAPAFVRLAYGQTLSLRELDYVTAQVALGTRPARILWRTVLPNIGAPLIVQFSLTVAAALVLESGLSFLGLGVVPPSPSWGLMIGAARSTMDQAPLLLLWPCLALSGTVLVLNLICDRLRDVLDPRASHGSRPGFLQRRAISSEGGRRIQAVETRSESASALLAIRHLTLTVASPEGPIPVVRDVGLTVGPGETLAIVGESGSGKTLTALAIMGLLPAAVQVQSGEILFASRDGHRDDILRLSERELRGLRGRSLAMIFQDPSSSLNPLMTVGRQLVEAMRAYGPAFRTRARAVELLRQVGLPDPERRIRAFPHELSGGQRQRVMIATALANDPRLLLADEPTTALDVTVQAQILDLLARLKSRAGGMSIVFVTHNLALVAQVADRVAVMYAGEVLEEGPVRDVFAAPRHPYTAALIASAAEGEAARLPTIPGIVPQPWAMPPGCRFAPRCPEARPDCEADTVLEHPAPDRVSRCRHWREVT